jgi:hypothetical protein
VTVNAIDTGVELTAFEPFGLALTKVEFADLIPFLFPFQKLAGLFGPETFGILD